MLAPGDGGEVCRNNHGESHPCRMYVWWGSGSSSHVPCPSAGRD
jgi:hypothetical protein